MRQATRRWLGVTALTILVLGWIIVSMLIGAIWFVDAGPLVQITYFAIAGVAWVVPAAAIIRWMRGPAAPPRRRRQLQSR